MIAFIKNNPLVVLLVGVILVIALILLLIKISGKEEKPNKSSEEEQPETHESDQITEKKAEEPEKNTEESEQKEEPQEEEKNTETEEETEDETDKKKKSKKTKKEVVPVFVSEEPKQSPTAVIVDERVKQEEEQLLDRMEFVKSTDKVFKLANREKIVKVPESEFTEEEMIAVQSIIDKATAKKQAREPHHFDRSIRLSNFSKSGDYGSMFVSHIMDERTKINIYNHLDINDDYFNRLYERTYNTIKNSGIKSHTDLINNGEIDDDIVATVEGDKREDMAAFLLGEDSKNYLDPAQDDRDLLTENNLTSKNIYVVDTIMNRKNKYKRK